MNKLTLIACTALLALGCSVPSAPTVQGFSAAKSTVPALDTAVTPALPTVLEMPETTIRAFAPRHTVAKVAAPTKHWACGDSYDNGVGGRNSDCGWY